MLRIKRYREGMKARALRRAQQQYDQQVRLLDQAHSEAERCHDHRLREEQAQFETVRNQAVRLQRIETMNRYCGQLREQEALMHARVLERQQQLEGAQVTLKQAREAHLQSLRACEKFQHFLDIRRAIEDREHMLAEEGELEEIASAAHQLKQAPF